MSKESLDRPDVVMGFRWPAAMGTGMLSRQSRPEVYVCGIHTRYRSSRQDMLANDRSETSQDKECEKTAQE
jgi:hypothetical protein